MKASTITALCFIIPAAIIAAIAVGPGEYRKHKARKITAAILHDPDSAQFRNLRAIQDDIVCGEVNGKNLFGAYAGYQKFIYSNGRALIYEEVTVSDVDRLTWNTDSCS